MHVSGNEWISCGLCFVCFFVFCFVGFLVCFLLNLATLIFLRRGHLRVSGRGKLTIAKETAFPATTRRRDLESDASD